TRRQLHDSDQVALVLLGDEAGRGAGKLEPRHRDQPDIGDQHNSEAAQQPPRQLPVTVGKPFEATVEAAEPCRQQARCKAARGADLAACGLSSSAQSAGLRVSDTTQEITVEAAIVTANWRKNCPVMPDRKADGTKTAHNVSAIETSAPPTSSMVRC